MLLLIAALFCSSCYEHRFAGNSSVSARIVTLSTDALSKKAKGEQNAVLTKRGKPQTAYTGPLGIERWVYCGRQGAPLIVEFDVNGMILSEWRGIKADCQTPKKTAGEI